MPQIRHRHNLGGIDMLQTDKGFQNTPHEEITDDDLLNNQSAITGQMDRLNRIMASRLVKAIEHFDKTSESLSNRLIFLNGLLVFLTVVLVIDVLLRWFTGP